MKIGQLTVLQGKKAHLGQVFLIQPNQERLLGRSSVCNFIVDDPMVSGLHCLFILNQGQCLVKDLLSANGIFRNDQLVDIATLAEHDVLRIGRTIFEFAFYKGTPAKGKTYITGEILSFLSDEGERFVSKEEEVPSLPEKGTPPLGRLITDHRDLNICRLAIKNNLLTHAQVRECLAIQQELKAIQVNMALSEILVEREFLNSQQIEQLLREHNYYKILNKDHYFSKVALKNKLVTQQQLTECLDIQKEYLSKTDKIPRLGEILVRQGYLSIHQNNKIIKAIANSPRSKARPEQESGS